MELSSRSHPHELFETGLKKGKFFTTRVMILLNLTDPDHAECCCSNSVKHGPIPGLFGG